MTATLVHVDFDGRDATVVRHAAEVRPHGLVQPDTTDAHLVAHVDHPGRQLRDGADVLFGHLSDLDDDPLAWLAETAQAHPRCELIAATGPERSLVRTADGRFAELTGRRPAGYVSVVYAWLDEGRALDELAPSLIVDTGGVREEVTVRVW